MNKEENQIQIEAPFLATLMKDNTLLDEVRVRPNHFIDSRHQKILEVIRKNYQKGEPCDLPALMRTTESNLLQMGGRNYLREVYGTFLTTEKFDWLQGKIIDYAMIERARHDATNFLYETRETHDPEILNNLTSKLSIYETAKVGKRETFQDKVKRRAKKHAESKANGLTGLNTGFLNLNRITDGYQPQSLYIIGARPSVGKTAFALNSMWDATRQDNVFPTFFSRETADGPIIDRLLAKVGRINLMKLKNVNKHIAPSEKEFMEYQNALTELMKYELDIDEHSETVAQMRSALRRNMKEYPDKKHVVFIDYLTTIKPSIDRNDEVREIKEITQELKDMANDFNIPVICLAQLTRGVESRQDKRPLMSDLRGGGAIEQIADFIGFLYREDYQNQKAQTNNEVELIVQKFRDGQTGVLKYKFKKTTQEYIEVNE